MAKYYRGVARMERKKKLDREREREREWMRWKQKRTLLAHYSSNTYEHEKTNKHVEFMAKFRDRHATHRTALDRKLYIACGCEYTKFFVLR